MNQEQANLWNSTAKAKPSHCLKFDFINTYPSLLEGRGSPKLQLTILYKNVFATVLLCFYDYDMKPLEQHYKGQALTLSEV